MHCHRHSCIRYLVYRKASPSPFKRRKHTYYAFKGLLGGLFYTTSSGANTYAPKLLGYQKFH